MVSEDKPYVGGEGKSPSRVAGECRAHLRCRLPVRSCCCAQPGAARTCSCLLFSLANVPANIIQLLFAGLAIDFTYGAKLFHPTEPDKGNIDPMPVLLIVSQDKVVRSWQLCNLGGFLTAAHVCCTALLESVVLMILSKLLATFAWDNLAAAGRSGMQLQAKQSSNHDVTDVPDVLVQRMVRQSLFMQPVPFPSSNFRLVRLQNHAGLSHCHMGAIESRHLSAYMPFSSPQVAHHLPGWRTSWPYNSDLHSQVFGQPATCVAALMAAAAAPPLAVTWKTTSVHAQVQARLCRLMSQRLRAAFQVTLKPRLRWMSQSLPRQMGRCDCRAEVMADKYRPKQCFV